MEILSMPSGISLDIDIKETYRYLGYHFPGNIHEDPELKRIVTELTEKEKKIIAPRCAYEIYGLKTDESACYFYKNRPVPEETPILVIESRRLSAHIKECSKAILFAATIGPGADTIIRRYSGSSSLKPAVLQAIGAAAIEAYADEVTEQIKTAFPNIKMRFSPGYGDFSLEHQKDFFRLLELEKNLGMNLNNALLMTPTKSITAVIGILPDPKI